MQILDNQELSVGINRNHKLNVAVTLDVQLHI